MKRSWMGLGLLAIMLAIGLLFSCSMEKRHQPIAAALDQAADCALRAQWEQAAALSEKAQQQWEAYNTMRSFLFSHAPLEEADAAFAELSVYLQTRETVAFASLCRKLASDIRAMGSASGLSFENLL